MACCRNLDAGPLLALQVFSKKAYGSLEKYHASDIEPCVNVQNFGSPNRFVVAGQKPRGEANFIRCHCPPQGRIGDGYIDDCSGFFPDDCLARV